LNKNELAHKTQCKVAKFFIGMGMQRHALSKHLPTLTCLC